MIIKTTKNGNLLNVGNVHSANCGEPPTIDATGKSVFLFENDYGEQWVLVGDRQKKSAMLYGGDMKWTPVEVNKDTLAELGKTWGPLSQTEFMWLVICCHSLGIADMMEMIGA